MSACVCVCVYFLNLLCHGVMIFGGGLALSS